MDLLSTTSLANELDITSSELFSTFKAMGWTDKVNNRWILTEAGIAQGGQIRSSTKFGDYIVWPEKVRLNLKQDTKTTGRLLNATFIGKTFEISSKRLNLILNELGWIEKTIAGWAVTTLGKKLGGRQFEHETSGGTYVLWPEMVLENKDLLDQFKETKSTKVDLQPLTTSTIPTIDEPANDFRKTYKAEYRTKDGHYVRSKAEMAIDDYLYLWGIPHAYEKKLPNTDENVYSDFHIPSGKGRTKAVYIEYWGIENDEKYNSRKAKKLEIYETLGLSLIQLNDGDIKNIEDNLQKYLRQHGINVSMD